MYVVKQHLSIVYVFDFIWMSITKIKIITKFRLPKMTAAKGNTPAVLETQNNDDAEMKAQLEARRKQLEAEQAVCLI